MVTFIPPCGYDTPFVTTCWQMHSHSFLTIAHMKDCHLGNIYLHFAAAVLIVPFRLLSKCHDTLCTPQLCLLSKVCAVKCVPACSGSLLLCILCSCHDQAVRRVWLMLVLYTGAGYTFGIFCVINLVIWALAGFMGVTATSLAMKTFRSDMLFMHR